MIGYVCRRLVLSELLTSIGVPDEKFASTCVLVDKLDKLPADEVRAALLEQGLSADSAETLLKTRKPPAHPPAPRRLCCVKGG